MFLIIAFLGGMISLLSPCIPPGYSTAVCRVPGATTAYSGVARGMIVMFTLVALRLPQPATGSPSDDSRALGRTVVLAIAALALIFHDIRPAYCRPGRQRR